VKSFFETKISDIKEEKPLEKDIFFAWQKYFTKNFVKYPLEILEEAKNLHQKFNLVDLVQKKFSQNYSHVNYFPKEGVFMTGIESSDPWVGDIRRNQLKEAHNFYENFEDRLVKIHDLGIRWLRFGVPYSEAHSSKEVYDFEFFDKVAFKCSGLKIELVADLLHFGLPEWMHENNKNSLFFQNTDFPEEFAKYAGVFARRYPGIKYFTVVNEPFVTAYFSTKLGIWNEKIPTSWHDDQAFVKAITNIARAAILARKEIENVWKGEGRKGEPIFVQNESFEKAFASFGSKREQEAKRFNIRRFAALDLITGHKNHEMYRYLRSQGMSKEQYKWFLKNGSNKNFVLGIDHYPWCIHTYEQGRTVDHTPAHQYQLYNLIKEYWQRYRVPLLHTEINGWPDHAGSLMLQTFDVLSKLRKEGFPILGMTWYGDEYQVGWQSALTGEDGFKETPVGLYYKGERQLAGELYRDLIATGFPPFEPKKFELPFFSQLTKVLEILK
jgi:beta-glucosidase